MWLEATFLTAFLVLAGIFAVLLLEGRGQGAGAALGVRPRGRENGLRKPFS